MLRKFLFIGLGGSGGKTLRYLRHDLEQWLDQIGWDGDFPSAWQMLHIDTPTAQDGSEISDVPMLPTANYLGLVMNGIDFSSISSKLTASGEHAGRELASWRVDPTFLQVPITTGAGQFRAVGRTIGLAYAGKILEAMRAAHMRLSAAQAGAELAEIHQLAFGTQADTPLEPIAIVVSSLSGGTGAGLLLDTCDLLRQLPGTWADHSFGMLYASDVFQHLGDLATAGVQPNALSALSEVMNGYWLTANSPRASALFQLAGAPVPLAKSGPAYPFLVGAANTKGVTFGDQKAVYAMMGRALRSWTTDPAIQVELIEYTKANWQSSAAGNAVKADVVMRDHQPVFDAFGYAEVSLGVDRLQQYSSERLARLAATWLWQAHSEQARQIDKDDVRPPAEIVDDLARDHLVQFLQGVGLHERGDSNNQIIDALRPPDADSLLIDGTATVLQLATAGTRDLDANGWTTRIMEFLGGAAEEYEHAYDHELRGAARSWVETAPQQIIDTTTDFIASYGLQTAAHVIELVVEELDSVCSELAEEVEEYRRWSADARGSVAAELALAGRIPSGHPQVEEAIHAGLWCSGGYQGEAKRRQVAIQLMREFAAGFLTPLARSIRSANSELNLGGFVGDGLEPPIVAAWADEAVSESMIPPRNEQVVIDLDDFAEIFNNLLGRSTRCDRPGDQTTEARTAVIDARFLQHEATPSRPASAISIRTTWSPDPALLLGGATPRTNATFDPAFSPDDLLDRAKAWVLRQGTAFERFLNSDLRSYLDDNDLVDPDELAKRRARFRAALSAALDSAEPLVQIDPSLLSILHQKSDLPRHAVPGQLPFREHPVEDSIREILAAKVGGQVAATASFTTSSNVRNVSISSTLGAAHDPLVFSSITSPIVAGWSSAAQSAPGRTNFWNNRRARPLAEFIPASQEVILAMTGGWFTGLLLGQVDRAKPAIAHDGGIASFPSVLLRDAGTPRDILPAVLESMALAYIEVAKLHTLVPIHAYVALRDLGVQPGLPSYESAHVYDRLNVVLDQWIRTGETGPVLVEGFAIKTLGTDDHTPQGRRDVALQLVHKNLDEYRSELQAYLKRGRQNPAALGPAYGIWPGMSSIIEQALSDLAVALERADLGDDDMVM